MLTWISEQAKWVIYIFIVFILAGLLFMDMSQLHTDKTPPVAKVNGESIQHQEFSTRLQQAQQAQQGANLSEAQHAKLRTELLNQFIQERLLSKVIKSAGLVGSDIELWNDLVNDPIPGVKNAPAFKTDSVFDPAKYRAWLDTTIAGKITDPQLIQYREYLRNQKIPQKQLQLLVTAGYHPSSLESRWTVNHRETRFQVWVAQAPIDSFAAPAVDSVAIEAYFKANPDSFYVQRDMSKVKYIALPVQASVKDEQSAKEWAQMLINQLKEGADFTELAKMNSEDQTSNDKGGDVSDLNAWGPTFVTALSTLDSGKIYQEPVRTAFGWHVIMSTGKGSSKDSVKVHARHILVKIAASTETVDSMVTKLKAIKEDVDAGKSFDEASKAQGLIVTESNWFGKGDELPGIGFLQGLNSYAFRNSEMPKTEEISSQVLQSKEVVALFVKADSIKAGSRNLAAFKPYIAGALANQKRLELAKQYLQSKAADIQGLVKIDSSNRLSIAKIILDTLDNASYEGFIPGLGYASPALYKVLTSQKPGVWGGIVDGARSATMVKIITRKDPEAASVDASIHSEISQGWLYASYSLFNEYLKNLQEGAKVVNNLDLYFAE